jgi:hypothetical protein
LRTFTNTWWHKEKLSCAILIAQYTLCTVHVQIIKGFYSRRVRVRNDNELIKLESSSLVVRRKVFLFFSFFLSFFLFSNLIIFSIYVKFLFPVVITNSMQQFPSWQANSSSLPHHMEHEGSLLSLQEPASCLHPKPDQSSPQPHPITWIYSLILSLRYLHVSLSRELFPSGIPTKTLYAPLVFIPWHKGTS